MNFEVQNVATAPVFRGIKTVGKQGGNGRGKRIRTSGPCLPKAGILASHVGFPLKMVGNAPHIKASVHDRITAEVQGSTLEHCLNFGPNRCFQHRPALTMTKDEFAMADQHVDENPEQCNREIAAAQEREHLAFMDGLDPKKWGYCYFIGCDDGPVKIGYSKNVERRLRDLRTEYWFFDLRILATIAGADDREQYYHEKFAKSRFYGEWFLPTPDILAEIERIRELSA